MMETIDRHILRKTKADIQAKLEYKLRALMRAGGTVFGSDHRVTNSTPIENYGFHVSTALQIPGLEPRPEAGRGKGRVLRAQWPVSRMAERAALNSLKTCSMNS